MQRQLGFEPHPGQVRFQAAINKYPRVFCAAGRKGGKSSFVSVKAWCQWMRMKDTLPVGANLKYQWPRRILLVTPQDDQLDIIFDQVAGFADERGVPLMIDRRSKGNKQLRTPWGSIFRGMTGRNPRAGRGYSWQKVFGDEAPYVENPRELFYEVIFPTLAEAQGQFIAIGSPDAPGSLAYDWKQRGEDPDDKEWGFVSWPSEENWYLPWIAEYVESLRRAGVPEDIIRREWMAEFVPRAGLVYPEGLGCVMSEEEERAVTPEIEKHARWYRFVDFGFTNPHVALVHARLGDTLYCWEEYYRQGLTLDEHAESYGKLDEKYDFELNVPDLAEPGSISFLSKYMTRSGRRLKGGWVARGPKPAVVDRVDCLRRLMATGRYRIRRHCCKNYVRELALERYPEAGEILNSRENPIDANNHCSSAAGYGAYYLFGKEGSLSRILLGGTRTSSTIKM